MTEEKQEIFEYNEVYLLDNDKMIWTKQETKGTPHPSGFPFLHFLFLFHFLHVLL